MKIYHYSDILAFFNIPRISRDISILGFYRIIPINIPAYTKDRLLDLVEEISDEDPFAPLKLLQVCRVSRFGHVLSVAPPSCVMDFARSRDEAAKATLATI